MGFKILAINPGSTSTKIALYDDEQPTLALTLRHSAEEIARFPRIIDQLDWRKEMVLEALAKNNFDVKSLSAVIGRGGLIKPIESGVYEVNAALKNDLVNAQREHASNLGGLIAEQEGKWKTTIPILDREQTRSLRSFADGVAESVYTANEADFVNLAGTIREAGFGNNVFSLLFCWKQIQCCIISNRHIMEIPDKVRSKIDQAVVKCL